MIWGEFFTNVIQFKVAKHTVTSKKTSGVSFRLAALLLAAKRRADVALQRTVPCIPVTVAWSCDITEIGGDTGFWHNVFNCFHTNEWNPLKSSLWFLIGYITIQDNFNFFFFFMPHGAFYFFALQQETPASCLVFHLKQWLSVQCVLPGLNL